MKKSLIIILFLLACLTTYAQDITGKWYGVLKVQSVKLRIVLNVNKDKENYKATMDSPDQNATGIPVNKIIFKDKKIIFEVAQAGIKYEGILNDNNIIEGDFKQMGKSYPLNLSHKKIESTPTKRPQEPKPPYPYNSEEVTFKNNKANINLSGTFTYPKNCKNYKVVILISGSGPQNRDEEIFGHKPFAVIADYLTRNKIGVLRFDDRGVGKSEGNFKTATTKDFADDVISAIKFLKVKKNVKEIGLIGHSEGGIIAPMIANKTKDISFIVMLAGPGIRGDKLMLMQSKYLLEAAGTKKEEIEKAFKANAGAFKIITQAKEQDKLKNDLKAYISNDIDKSNKPLSKAQKEKFIAMQIKALTTAWMQYFLKYDPSKNLEKLKCPTLILIGEKDLQVPPKENFKAIRQAIKKNANKDITLKELKGLNHLFQHCKTGSPLEYGKIEETFSPQALEEIMEWIKKH